MFLFVLYFPFFFHNYTYAHPTHSTHTLTKKPTTIVSSPSPNQGQQSLSPSQSPPHIPQFFPP